MTFPAKKSLFLLGAVGCALALSAFLGEILLRLADFPPALLCGWKATGIRAPIEPAELNQLGFRGQPIAFTDSDFVVVLMGDSSVQAEACAYEWMPERRLEHHLQEHGVPARIFSLGANGYGQDQQLFALEEYLRNYRADLAILWLTPDNDIWNNLFPTHWPKDGWPKPTFQLRGAALEDPAETWMQPLAGLKIENLIRRAIVSRDSAWESRLPPAYVPMEDFTGSVNRTWQTLWSQGGLRHENLRTEKSHLALGLAPPSDRMIYGLSLSRELIRRIDSRLAEHGARLVLFSHQVPLAPETDTNQVYGLNGKYYRWSRAQCDSNVQTLTAGFDYRRIGVTSPHPRVGTADPHLNQHAVDQVMQDLVETLGPTLSSSVRPGSFPAQP